MFTATNLRTRETLRFRKLDALVRRLGGNDFQVEHDNAFTPPARTVMILRSNRYGTHVVDRVRMDSADLDAVLPVDESS